MRDTDRLNVPCFRELLDVLVVRPVAHAGEVAVRARLSRVLGSGLAVHLEYRRPGPADHPAKQVDVVHLDGRGRRLVRLVNALQQRRDKALSLADDLRSCSEVLRVDLADLRGPLGWVRLDGAGELVEPDRVLVDEGLVNAAGADELV